MSTDRLPETSKPDRDGQNDPDVTRPEAKPELAPSTVTFRVQGAPGGGAIVRHFGSENLDGLASWVDTASRSSCPIGEDWGRALGDGVSRSIRQLTEATTHIPDVGEDFLGFHLVEELGRGAFGRVFLARQGELAGRQVVLKIAAEVWGETRALAQLQHTYIVPIYSVHAAAPFQAFCMPYFGGTTLGHVLADVISRDGLPQSGRHLITSLAERSRSRKAGLAPCSEDFKGDQTPRLERPDPGEELLEVRQAVSTGTTQATLRMYEGMSYTSSRSSGSPPAWPTAWPMPTSEVSYTAT